MTEAQIRRCLDAGDLDGARRLAGLPTPFSPVKESPALRLVQESHRFKALGRIEEAKERLARAEVCYRLALRFTPGDWETLGALGRVLAHQGLADQANSYLKAALWLTKGPIRADLHMVRGRLHLREGRKASAWRDMKAALRHDPGRKDAQEVLGQLKRAGLSPLARISPSTYLAAAGLVTALALWGRDAGRLLVDFLGG